MKLRDRARQVFGRDKHEHTVVAPKVHHAVFNDMRRRSTKIDDIVATPPQLGDEINSTPLDSKVWERLCEDTFAEYFGEDEPTVRGRDKINPAYRVNRELTDKQARSERFADLHSMTRGQTTESALAWMSAMESLSEGYGDELKEHGEQQNEVAESQAELESIDDQLAALRNQRQNAPGGQRTVDSIDQQIRDLAQEKRDAVTDLKQAIANQQASAGSLQDAVRAAVANATDAAEEAAAVASLLPGAGPGVERQLSTEQMLDFADRVSSSDILRSVLEMMGRMKLSMGSKRRQLRKGGNEEMVDIETGDDLALVLPHEKALLAHPIARLDFFRRFHERSLMQYEMWSEQELKRGPLIIIADGSASMAGAKNVFARGMSLAALAIANEEGRNAAAIEYGSVGEITTFLFSKDEPLNLPVALEFAEHFFCGGTNTVGALAAARQLMLDEAPFHTADLIILTDGIDIVDDLTIETRDELREMGVKIHGVAIGMDPSNYLLTVCDGTSSVFDFAGPNATSDRLAIDMS